MRRSHFDEEAYNRDEELALMLFRGNRRIAIDGRNSLSKSNLPGIVFLSVTTTPTEDEARRALCRVLQNRYRKPSGLLLAELAGVFDPGGALIDSRPRPRLRAVLKKRSRGHANPYANAAIASRVSFLRISGKHYDDAIEEVAAEVGKSSEHVRRIYGKDPESKVPLPRRRRRKR
jgi:hypothetical protein